MTKRNARQRLQTNLMFLIEKTGKDDYIFSRFTKIAKATVSFVMSVRLHETTRLPLDEFSRNLVFEDFSKICGENSDIIKIGQE